MESHLRKKLKKLGLKGHFTFVESLKSNVTTAWGVDWNEMFIARDILQNFYDANKDRVHEICTKVSANRTVTISAPGTFNIQKLFYLGSEKNSEDVGQYGEGFKAAAVCLLRDYNITPIAISGHDMYIIRLSEAPVPGTDMFPLIYDYYCLDSETEETKLILEHCSPRLTEALQNGLASFFYRENHPIVGTHLTSGKQGRIDVYHSKDGNGYIFFEKLLRAELGCDLPLVFVFNHSYAKIKTLIGRDRDRRTFTNSDDLKVFYDEMRFDSRSAIESILKATKNSLWCKGKGHAIFHTLTTWRYSFEEIFADGFYARSSGTSQNPIESFKIEQIENEWKKQGRTCLPSYFNKFGVISAQEHLEKMRKEANNERKEREKRTPTETEWLGIHLCKEIMGTIAPELKYVFDTSKTSYTVGETQFVLGELINNRSYRSYEVYLSADIFVADFPVFFSTVIHEHAHIYGFDGSRSFTDALTKIIEMTLTFREVLQLYIEKWALIRNRIIQERNVVTTANINHAAILDTIPEHSLRTFIKNLPETMTDILIKQIKREELVNTLHLVLMKTSSGRAESSKQNIKFN